MSLTIQSGGSLTIQGGGGGGGGGATVGTFANRPAAGNAGALYIATDSPIAQWVDDGSAWRPLIQGQALGTQVPAASAFTAFNAGTFTFSDASGTIRFECTTGTGASNVRGAALSLSSSTAYVEACIADTSPGYNASTVSSTGVMLRESSSGKAVGIFTRVQQAAAAIPACAYLEVVTINNNGGSAFSAEISLPINAPKFFRVKRSGSDIVVEVSPDRLAWKTSRTFATSSVFTSAPDQAAFGIIDYGPSYGLLTHFKYGSL